ncbi:hypothetical protein [Vibrio scophthalmi]|uniref:Uncharacterized protein n=1 Tax=Vibrio scophthalmi TaxID=45658 RepID=A0A1C7FIR2_9VIBR|nr:hypothetical protein [Vibrio scophthalmi]ANU39353.1 hypothetical protein VSVS05_04317 [Vibrio scophthalmi]ANU39498.1 hypothetical protein VSVS05_04463 [Vibrio scophthalmi]
MQPTVLSTFGQFVTPSVANSADFIDITEPAHTVGFHFPHVVMSQHAWFTVIDVSDMAINIDKDALTIQLLRQVRRAARKAPHSAQVSFTVCKPPTTTNCYVNRPATLVARIDTSEKQQPILVIMLEEEEND